LHLSNFLASLSSKIVANIPAALALDMQGGAVTSSVAGRYYIPPINGRINLNNHLLVLIGWHGQQHLKQTKADGRITLDYKNLYEDYYILCSYSPSDFNMKAPAAANTPQVWKFIVVNNK
jgi:hypothetical protein